MKICFLDSSTIGEDIDISCFEKLGEFVHYATTSQLEVGERVQDADVIITNKVIMNAETLKNAKNLKLIALTATGYNNVDLEYCKANNIAVTNVAGYSTESVAQHTFSMLFYIMSSSLYFDYYVKTKTYCDSPIFTHLDKPWNELAGKTWGIIGLGKIGQSVARKAEAFGCNVIYYSTSGKNENSQYKKVSLKELMTTSDIVSIHCPLNDNTLNLIDWEELCMMKETAILINVGRGKIVNENMLAKALNSNEIAAAALDVLENEPIDRYSKLLDLYEPHKLFITPHIAWASVEARTRLIDEVYKNISDFSKDLSRNRII